MSDSNDKIVCYRCTKVDFCNKIWSNHGTGCTDFEDAGGTVEELCDRFRDFGVMMNNKHYNLTV